MRQCASGRPSWPPCSRTPYASVVGARPAGAEDVDETYLKVAGQWQYLYRAIDSAGNLVDVFLSANRNQAAAEAFFRSAVGVVSGIVPDTITTDKHAGNLPALEKVFGDDVEHRTLKFTNNHLERDHRGVKVRTQPMRDFKSSTSAIRFCRAPDEVRNFLRPATRRNQRVPAAQRRAIHVQRVAALRDMVAIVSFMTSARRPSASSAQTWCDT
jgi:transposase-like protein